MRDLAEAPHDLFKLEDVMMCFLRAMSAPSQFQEEEED